MIKKEHTATGWKAFRQALKPQEGTMPREATVIMNEPKDYGVDPSALTLGEPNTLNAGLATAMVTGMRRNKPRSESTNARLAGDMLAASPISRLKY